MQKNEGRNADVQPELQTDARKFINCTTPWSIQLRHTSTGNHEGTFF